MARDVRQSPELGRRRSSSTARRLGPRPGFPERAQQRLVAGPTCQGQPEYTRDETQLLDDLGRPLVFRRRRDEGERAAFSGGAAGQRDGNNGCGPNPLPQNRRAVHLVGHLIEPREVDGLVLLPSRRDERNGRQHPWIGKRPQPMLAPGMRCDDVHVVAVGPPQDGVVEPQALADLAQARRKSVVDRVGLDRHKMPGKIGDQPLDGGPVSACPGPTRIERVIVRSAGTRRARCSPPRGSRSRRSLAQSSASLFILNRCFSACGRRLAADN